MDKKLLDILACPKCKGDVKLKGGSLRCSKCKSEYGIENDVPIMLVK